MALAILAIGGALAARAQNKRSRQITDLEDTANTAPDDVNNDDLYDPLRRGPKWARDNLANRALHFRKRYPQPYTRPLHDNGQSVVLCRNQVGPETAKRMQHIYADTLPEMPPFFYCKTVSLNRQIQPFQMPSYQPGLTFVDVQPKPFNRYGMPYNYPAGHAVA